ncbi:MAG: Luciferase-like monooxygenase [Conexibacter sp.]|jgi:alkanesulfonate monooxygenase SsuD/methylene tetrahydromethanopterin reductase-like flavin-dependent oxidoreductase (luciferase family)|nr:Luciferase-like monooxygenase [Conexibacter sp.]
MEFATFLAAHNLDGRSESQLFDDLTEQAVVAEELGFDLVWLVEHHFNNYNLLPDPLQLATRIFERTERIRVGVAVFILPNHHPLQLAGKLAQIDVLYPGRFETAVGRGSSRFEALKLGNAMEVEESRAYFSEHLEVMTRGWMSDVDISHHGRFFDFDDVTILPRPVTKPLPALWLSGLTPQSITGQVATCRKLGIPPKIITSPFRNPMSELQKGYDAFEQALADNGFARSDGAFAVNRTTYVGETMADVHEAIPQMIDVHRGLYAQLEGNERYVNGRIEIRPVKNEVTAQEVLETVPFGDPDTVREQIRQYAEMGVDQFSAYFDLGYDQETTMRSMRLFAESVMPEFQRDGVSTTIA